MALAKLPNHELGIVCTQRVIAKPAEAGCEAVFAFCTRDAFLKYHGKPVCLEHAIVRAAAMSQAVERRELEVIAIRDVLTEAERMLRETKLIGRSHPFSEAVRAAMSVFVSIPPTPTHPPQESTDVRTTDTP